MVLTDFVFKKDILQLNQILSIFKKVLRGDGRYYPQGVHLGRLMMINELVFSCKILLQMGLVEES